MGRLTEDELHGGAPGASAQGSDWPHSVSPGHVRSTWGIAPQPSGPSAPPRRRRGRLVALIIAGALVAGVVAVVAGAQGEGVSGNASASGPAVAPARPSALPSPDPQTPVPTASATPDIPVAAPSGTAMAALAALPIKGRAPKTGYDRDNWAVWSDYDGNGCNERQDTLARDLTDVQRAGCEVVGGRLVDPYTGNVIVVPTADPQIDIDHVVSLSDAWQKGAANWSRAQLQRFASDPLNLLAVSSSANRSKSDGDAATWLPANTGYRCEMVARQIAVKTEYGLWVTQAEHDAMARVLSTCPDQQTPVRGVAPAPVQPGTGAAPTQPQAGVEVAPGLDPQFGSCKALKAAGYKGGYVKGVDPEYEWYRDGDGDGVVCE